MSKYQPLADFLNHLKADEWRPTFLELERILGDELPKSARNQESWWSNEDKGSGKHSQAWLSVGWHVERPDMDKEQVTFRRGPAGGDKAAAVMKQADAEFARTGRADKLKKVGLSAGVAAAIVAAVAGGAALAFKLFRRRK
jgi:hypothetical protein